MPMTLAEMNRRALAEIGAVIEQMDESQVRTLIERLAAARRIVIHGLGREGLMMKALAMRLYHMGLDVHVAGDVTAPPVRGGDLLLVSAGPGDLDTTAAMTGIAKREGATVGCITAVPTGGIPRNADFVVVLPAQTMANDQGGATSFLPMGSLYEATQFLFFEYLVLLLRDRLGVTPEAMRDRHANLE